MLVYKVMIVRIRGVDSQETAQHACAWQAYTEGEAFSTDIVGNRRVQDVKVICLQTASFAFFRVAMLLMPEATVMLVRSFS